MDGRSVLTRSDPAGTCHQAVSGRPLTASAHSPLRSRSCGRAFPVLRGLLSSSPSFLVCSLSLCLFLSLSSSLYLFLFLLFLSFSFHSFCFFLFCFLLSFLPPFLSLSSSLFLSLSFCFILSLPLSLSFAFSYFSFLLFFLSFFLFRFCRILETASVSHRAGAGPRSCEAHAVALGFLVWVPVALPCCRGWRRGRGHAVHGTPRHDGVPP